MNLNQQLHAHPPQPHSGEDILEGDTPGAAPDPHSSRSSSPDVLSGLSDLNLDVGDEQSQSKTGSDQSASHSADVPDCGCQQLNHDEQAGDERDRGIDQDEGIDQDVEVDRS
jgi:hypothetical protein